MMAAVHSKLTDTSSLVTKAAASLYDGNSAATLTLLAWPTGKTGRLKITISAISGHTDVSGTISVGSEAIVFTQAGTKLTTTSLTANPVITCANLDCHVHITVVDVAGQDILVETLSDVAISWNDTSHWVQVAEGKYTSMVETTATTDDTSVVVGSVLRKTGETTDYTVRAVKKIKDRMGQEIKRKLTF